MTVIYIANGNMPVYDTTALLEIMSLVSLPLTPDKVLAQFAEKTTGLLGVDRCLIFSWDRQNNTVVLLSDHISPTITPAKLQDLKGVCSLADYPTWTRVLQEQTALIVDVDDPGIAEAEKTFLGAFGWQTLLILPILFKGQSLGLMQLYRCDRQRNRFAADILLPSQALAGQVALALENARLSEEAKEGRLHAEAIQVIGQALASELDDRRIVYNVADFAYRLVGAQFVYVAVPETEGFRLVASIGQSSKRSTAIQQVDTSLDIDSPLDWVIWEKRALVVADIQTSPSNLATWQTKAAAAGWRAMVAVPMLAYNQLIGVLVAYTDRANFFTPNDVAILMSLASQAAVAIQNAQLFAEREAQRATLHRISLRLVNAQEEERRRISRELHDELGQTLTALKINLDLARQTLPANAPPRLQRAISDASLLATQTLETARNLSLELHPAILDDLGLVAALRWEVDRYEQRTGQKINFEVDLAGLSLRPELEITIYRIITEALTNIARHAQASHITLSVQIERGQVVAWIQDDGIGFDTARLWGDSSERRSLGLVGMRERSELLKGSFELISEPGQGTKIRVALPIKS